MIKVPLFTINRTVVNSNKNKRMNNSYPQGSQKRPKIKLIFLYLPDVTAAIERVKNRVRQGGHNVPEQTIRRRYEKGWHNFQHIYKQLADTWVLFDNSGPNPKLLERG